MSEMLLKGCFYVFDIPKDKPSWEPRIFILGFVCLFRFWLFIISWNENKLQNVRIHLGVEISSSSRSEFDHKTGWIISLIGLTSHTGLQRTGHHSSPSPERFTASVSGSLNLGWVQRHTSVLKSFQRGPMWLKHIADFSSHMLPGTEANGMGHATPFLAYLHSSGIHLCMGTYSSSLTSSRITGWKGTQGRCNKGHLWLLKILKTYAQIILSCNVSTGSPIHACKSEIF